MLDTGEDLVRVLDAMVGRGYVAEQEATMSDAQGPIESGSEIDLALQRALEGASLRAGDAVGGMSVAVVGEPELSPVESGDTAGGADGD